MDKKVLMIGLDGATFTLLEPLIEDGVMPFLGRFVADGVHADLMSTRNPLTPPAWISMVTSRSPNVHGIYDFLRPGTLDDGGVMLKVNDFREIRCETVWSMASRQDKRVTSLNFYGMSPPPEINGYIASGFVPWKYLRKGMYPESLFDTVRNLPDFEYKTLGMDIGEEKKCVQGLIDGEHHDWIELQKVRDRAWTRLCCHLMETDRTDLTAVVLDGPDKLQHLFWRFVDPELAPDEPDEAWLKIREHCLEFYRELDRNIEEMVTAAGPDTNVILTSDHGFGATTEVVYLNEWLSRHGYLKWAGKAEDDATGKLTADRYRDHLSTIDWKRTLAYCPTPSSNAIYIKKSKNGSHGVSDAEYLDFCLNLRKQLLDYRDPQDDQPVFVGVECDKLEGRPFMEPSPDMTLHLRDGGFVSILKSSEVVIPRELPDGTHRPNGIFIARGPDIARHSSALAPLDLLDITPMLLYFLGLPVPEDLEGHVPGAVLRGNTLSDRPVEQSSATEATQRSKGKRKEATAEERDALIKQMKILGYMD